MKKRSVTWFLILLLSTYILVIDSGYLSNFRKDIILSKWIVGEWWAENIKFSEDAQEVTVKIDFVNSKHLIYYLSASPTNTGEELMTPARYVFTSKNKITVYSRARDTWNIERVGNQLFVDIGEITIPLTRMPRFERLFVFLLGSFIANVLLINKFHKRKNVPDQIRKFDNRLKYGIGAIFVAIGGMLAASFLYVILYLYPSYAYFFLFGNPWAQILIIEVFLVLLIIGANLIRERNIALNSFSMAKLHLGLTFIGGGIVGILVGLYFWVFFAYVASSYMGGLYLF